jgi:regulator of sigma D
MNNDLIQGYTHIKIKENLENRDKERRRREGFNSSSQQIGPNPYANQYIQFNTGEICYVSDVGLVRKMSKETFQYTPGQQGCPGPDQIKKIDSPWLPGYDIVGTVVSSSPRLVIGEPMTAKYESCIHKEKEVGTGTIYSPDKIIRPTLSTQTQSLLNETKTLQDQYDTMLEQYNEKRKEYQDLQNTIKKQSADFVHTLETESPTLNKNYYVSQILNGDGSDISSNYIGCYTDSSSNPALPNLAQGGSIYTEKQCSSTALNNGATLFGLQNFDPKTNLASCYYGKDKETAQKYGQAVSASCQQSSDGNAYGGEHTIAIYQTPSSEYYGAYNDQPNRAMTQVGTSDSYTYDTCLKTAQDSSASFFGLQYYNNGGAQCFTSNDFTTATQYGKSTNTVTGNDGKTYGGTWTNAIYVVTPTSKYEGCFNYRAGNPAIIQAPTSVTTFSQCQTYATQNGYKYFGIQGQGKNFFVINDLASATQYGANPCVQSPQDGKTYGLSGVNALYQLPNLKADASIVGRVGYVDSSSTLFTYPSSSLGLSTLYTKFINFVSGKTAFLGNSTSVPSSTECEQACNKNDSCYGYEFNSSTKDCQLLNNKAYPNTPISASTGTDLYIRNPSITSPPTGVNPDVTAVDSIFYSQFKNSGKNVEKAYNFARTLDKDHPQLANMEQQLLLIGQNLESLREKLEKNLVKLNNQSVTDYTGTGDYLKDYGDLTGRIETADSVKNNLENMIRNNQLILNQKNMVYLIWAVIAFFIVLFIVFLFYKFRSNSNSTGLQQKQIQIPQFQ